MGPLSCIVSQDRSPALRSGIGEHVNRPSVEESKMRQKLDILWWYYDSMSDFAHYRGAIPSEIPA